MQLYFIRHGQSVNNANVNTPNYVESSDTALSETGIAQAQALAKYLKEKKSLVDENIWDTHNRYGFGLTHIYSSLMERAATTAAFTVRALGDVPFSAWVDIHETGGIYAREKDANKAGLAGKPRSFFEKNFPEMQLPEGYDESGWWNRPFESHADRDIRARRVLAELLQRHGDKEGQAEHRVAFFSHGEFFMRLLCAMLNLPYKQAAHDMKFWFLMNNCAISRFDVRNGKFNVTYVNRVDHLPGGLVTQ
jgi:2,3-bisphosphoglycerate-dependent phosphoglycerate mutase